MLSLSVLDLSPVRSGSTPAEAIEETVALAKVADRLGYGRYWVAEHHSMRAFAGASPEILIAAMARETSRIRLGSGGVMLVNHSPLHVAEQFMTLEALAPGRIDLGVGRALGADARTGGALRSAGSEAFPQYFALLSDWLMQAAGVQAMDERHPARGIVAQPAGPHAPELFLLCSSADSAAQAGELGVGMVFAEFIAANSPVPAEARDVVAAYRAAFRPSPLRAEPWAGVGLGALAADTDEEARRLDGPRRAWTVDFHSGRPGEFPTLEAAPALLAAAPPALLALADRRSTVGDGASVRARLADKLADSAADALFVINFAPTFEARVRSLELMAGLA